MAGKPRPQRPLGHFVSPKHKIFAEVYAKTWNATKAAIAAGYPAKRASIKGSTLSRREDVQRYVDSLAKRQFTDDSLTGPRVLEELRRIAFADIRTLYDEEGRLKPLKDWDAEQGAAIQQCEVVSGNLDKGDGKRDRLTKLKTWDKVKALELLAKHFSLTVEKTEITGGITVTWLPPEPRVQDDAPSPAPEILTGTTVPVSDDNRGAKARGFLRQLKE